MTDDANIERTARHPSAVAEPHAMRVTVTVNTKTATRDYDVDDAESLDGLLYAIRRETPDATSVVLTVAL